MSDFHLYLNTQFDIYIKGMCNVLKKTAALIIEIDLGDASQGILKY